jgi:NADH-quinone oxidoreductase subunit F
MLADKDRIFTNLYGLRDWGLKGAMAGILIGGGGTIAATEGKEVELPQGSVLRVRIESPVPL